MKKFYLLLIAIFTINIANAQWQQTSLDSNNVNALIIKDSIIFAGTDNGVFISSDSGNSWTARNNNLPSSMYHVTSFAIDNNYVFVSAPGGVYRSSDNGINWYPSVYGTNLGSIAFYCGGTNYVKSLNKFGNYICAAGCQLFYSTDDGYFWHESYITNHPSSAIRTLASDSLNFYAGTDYGVFESHLGLGGWQLIGLTDVVPLAIALRSNNIFVGTGSGMFLTSNNGTSWSSINNGLTATIIWSLITQDTMLIAGTNNGVYLSIDNGNNWIQSGLTNFDIQSLVVYGDQIFVGTIGNGITVGYGVWKHNLLNLGINKINVIEKKLTIYPNPTLDKITITTNINKEQRIEIFNIFGKTVYSSFIYNNATINTSSFQSGIYIIKLYTDKETIVKKFVKE